MDAIRKHKEAAALTMILLLAGFLSVFNIWNLGYSNEFYAASVKSMLTSWKNFFFVSLDPGGWVTVDKPPVSLWIQAAFAKVFGFYGWSIILPQCLAAVASVAVVYRAVRRGFGRTAGLVSALVLALSPIFLVVSKTNNTDSILILFMVLAARAVLAAAEKGRLRGLLLSMVFLGIAYNAKTLEAFLILPALFAAYFFGTDLKLRRRIGHLALAAVVLAAVSLSWSAIVDLTPASERPYVDNSTNNSELELALGYNGIQRITGQTGFGGGGQQMDAGGSDTAGPSSNGAPSGSGGDETGDFRGGVRGGFTGGGNGMFNGGGGASILRLFNTTLGGQDSWLLPFGLISVIALLLGMPKSAQPDPKTHRKLLRAALLWGGSVVTMVGYFSVAQFFHPYYISAMAPFLAALIGIGFTQMLKLYRSGKAAGWLLPASFAATLGAQAAMLSSYREFAGILIPAVCVLTGVPAVVLAALLLRKRTAGKAAAVCAALGLAGLLIAPAVWTSYSVFRGSFNSAIPSAGPSAETSGMFGQGNGGRQGMPFGNGDGLQGGDGQNGERRDGGEDGSSSDSKLIEFLESHNTGEKFLAAVPSASEAEPIILATGKPVMAVGGFSGNAETLTVEKLRQMVNDGEVRYFLVGGRGRMGGSDDITEWVEENGTAVDSGEWSAFAQDGSDGRMGGGQTLYDLSARKSTQGT